MYFYVFFCQDSRRQWLEWICLQCRLTSLLKALSQGYHWGEWSYLVYLIFIATHNIYGFPGGWMVKNLPANAGDSGLTLGSGRSPGEGNNPHQYSCLGNPMDRGAWLATVQKSLKRVRHDLETKQQQQYINSFISTVIKLVFWK